MPPVNSRWEREAQPARGQLCLRIGERERLAGARERLLQEGTELRVVLDQVVDEIVVRFHRLDGDQPVIRQLDDERLTRIVAPAQDPLWVGLKVTQSL